MYTDEQLRTLEHWTHTGEQLEPGGVFPLLPRFDLFGPRGPALVVLTLLGNLRSLQSELGAMERHNKRLVDDLHAAEENLRDRFAQAYVQGLGASLGMKDEQFGRDAYSFADAVLSQRNGKP